MNAGTKLKGGYGGWFTPPPNLEKMPFRRANGHTKIVFAGQNIERKFKCRLQSPLFIVFKIKNQIENVEKSDLPFLIFPLNPTR